MINFFIPELNDLYSGFVPKPEWLKCIFSKVCDDKDVKIAVGHFLNMVKYMIYEGKKDN